MAMSDCYQRRSLRQLDAVQKQNAFRSIWMLSFSGHNFTPDFCTKQFLTCVKDTMIVGCSQIHSCCYSFLCWLYPCHWAVWFPWVVIVVSLSSPESLSWLMPINVSRFLCSGLLISRTQAQQWQWLLESNRFCHPNCFRWEGLVQLKPIRYQTSDGILQSTGTRPQGKSQMVQEQDFSRLSELICGVANIHPQNLDQGCFNLDRWTMLALQK